MIERLGLLVAVTALASLSPAMVNAQPSGSVASPRGAFCICLQWPVWDYGNGMILYFAQRHEQACNKGCTPNPTNVLHPYHNGPLVNGQLPHNCRAKEGLPYSTIATAVAEDASKPEPFDERLPQYMDADEDDFTESWGADMSAYRRNTDLKELGNFKLASDGFPVDRIGEDSDDEKINRDINARLFLVDVDAPGFKRRFIVAFETAPNETPTPEISDERIQTIVRCGDSKFLYEVRMHQFEQPVMLFLHEPGDEAE